LYVLRWYLWNFRKFVIMIIDFSVENFRSIKEMQTLSMSAASIVSKHKEIDEQNLIKVSDKLSLLKSKAIYGANASGKSNIIKALMSFIAIVSDSVKNDRILFFNIYPFSLSTETDDKPCYFQLTFLLNNIHYRYGFEASKKEITSEWLFGTPGKKEVNFFTREGNNISVNEKQFKEGHKIIELYASSGETSISTNSLFLTVVKSFTGGVAKDIVDYISKIIVISVLSDNSLFSKAQELLSEENKKQIGDFLKISDIGIEHIGKLEYGSQDEKDVFVATAHKKFDSNLNEVRLVNFSMDFFESDGTKKMFGISHMILQALNEKIPIIIDEFDARLHPLLTKKIVELFNSDSNKGSQLIFATHDTNLLDSKLLRRDQICFVEKDKYGASHFYTLVDFKGVRNDASFEKDYIAGRYGAIPFLGDFNSVIEG